MAEADWAHVHSADAVRLCVHCARLSPPSPHTSPDWRIHDDSRTQLMRIAYCQGVVGLLALSARLVAAVFDENSWEAIHMRTEHHVTMYDDDSFFRLHDLDRTGFWTPDDVTSIYGVKNNKEQDAFKETDVPESKVQEIVTTVMKLIDTDLDGRISRDEWINFKSKGGFLPDFGFAGHHEDEETEFDIHHVEIFHNGPDDDDESKWNHPEDIEHFKHHDEKYHAAANADPLANIPPRYRKTEMK